MSLKNKIFLNLRPRDQAQSLSKLLKNQGANVIEFSCLEIVPANLILQQIKEIETAGCLVFTSSSGVRIAASKKLISKSQLIACIGEQTKKCAEDLGFKVNFVPKQADSESFAKELVQYLAQHANIKSIALLRAKKADGILKEILVENHYKVLDIVLYDVKFPDQQQEEINNLLGNIDKISMPIFTSSEMVKNLITFLEISGEQDKIHGLKKLTVAAIGIKTEQSLKKLGFNRIIKPQKACIESLVNEIVAHYEQNEK